jgi:hypothetical protein
LPRRHRDLLVHLVDLGAELDHLSEKSISTGRVGRSEKSKPNQEAENVKRGEQERASAS